MRVDEIRSRQERQLQQRIAESRRAVPERSDEQFAAALIIAVVAVAVLIVLGAIAWRLWGPA